MDTIFAKVAGLDVHQKFITVAVRCRSETGKLFAEVRTYRTMTRDLRAMADYLEDLGVTHVALESTGVLWKPVWNILEGRFTLLLVNPRISSRCPAASRTSATLSGSPSCCSAGCSAAASCRGARLHNYAT